MLQRFVDEIENKALFNPTDTVLLAVSGGMDSVTMCELFYMAGYRFAIAHCNFRLRAEASDGDEVFVKQLAKRYGVPIHSVAFDTTKYAEENKLSIEEAARNLRYDFFDKLIEQYEYSCVATAHHRDDAIETFMLNLMRGTGIVGLHGILQKNDRIIRPLLCFSRDEITDFIEANNLQYRTDATNATLDYKRNKVRHLLVPLFRELAPAFDKTMQNNMKHIADVEMIYRQDVDTKRNKFVQPHQNGYKISMKDLETLNPLRTYLYEFLSPFGFGETVIQDIIKVRNTISGKRFLTKDYYLIKDRDYLFVYPYEDDSEDAKYIIRENDICMDVPISLEIHSMENNVSVQYDFNKYNVYFDKDKLTFPLCLRRWKNGDKFQPFGMKGKRKISDLFTDQKLSLHDKKNIWLLCNADDEILWVMGLRTDDRFKITSQTRNILNITWKV
ncbi:MAG: tRNA lysidine(34) synthetase TilS [Bacteroidales bacterium]|nr:tRNA lysidine(34) synthetase TilS [Bacteroidales bacterium]